MTKKKRTTKADGAIEDVDKGVRTGARRGEREHAGLGRIALCCAGHVPRKYGIPLLN